MDSVMRIEIAADPDDVFALAANVEAWPRVLPHYRWVRRLGEYPDRRVLAMAAWRDIYPVRWTSEVEADTEKRRLRFRHLGGPAKGMAVEWQIDPTPTGTHVAILHHFAPNLPLLGRLYAEYIVGRLFVENIAGKTLRRMKQVAEAGARARAVREEAGADEGRGRG